VKVVSVNTSTAKQTQYKDKTISTGIFKKPVYGAVSITENGLQGDEQVDLVNHGGEHKAVYAFSADHYAYWQQTLNVNELSHGSFGENLTITSLDEHTLCIGDQLQIGSAVVEITQPRVPCFKLGLALNNEKMPRMFVEQAETGIYFRVLSAGAVQVGDEVKVLHRDQAQLAVKTLFRAYFDRDMPVEKSLKILQSATTVAALSKEWMEKVESKLSRT
jgi:MOSC domain-containing protein YiiM